MSQSLPLSESSDSNSSSAWLSCDKIVKGSKADSNIHQHSSDPKPSETQASALASWLRAFGAGAVLFSLYSFLFRGWEGSDDLIRYSMLLGHTLLLVVIALFSGKWLQEGKGPRLLMILALISVPINFAVLGAFLFAGFNQAVGFSYPSYMIWSVGGLTTAATLAVVASVLLLPVIQLAFKTLARGMNSRLSSLFIVGNLALLIPLREAHWVFALAALLAIITLFISTKTARQRTEAKTFEGATALLIQFLPVAILLGRSIWLYSAELLLFVGVAVAVFIILRHLNQYLGQLPRLLCLSELLSACAAIFAGVFCAAFLSEQSWISISLSVVVGGLVASAMLYELSLRAHALVGFYRYLASTILVMVTLVNVTFNPGVVSSLMALILGVVMIGASHSVKQRSVFITGVIMVLISGIELISSIWLSFDVSYWLALALMGVAAIVFASAWESKGPQLKSHWQALKNNYADWAL